MAQKIVTICDVHQRTEDSEVPGDEWIVSIQAPGDAKPTTYALDACDTHAKPLVDLLAELATSGRVLGGRGRPAKATAARQSTPAPGSAHTAVNGGIACPADGCGAVMANRSSLGSHVRNFHHTSIAKLTGAPEPYACAEPGCGFTTSRPQGLTAHRRASGHAA